MTEYESILQSQLDALNTEGMQAVIDSGSIPEDVAANLDIKEIVESMFSGDAAISQNAIFEWIKTFFLGELRDIIPLAVNLICVCIASGILGSFASGFGNTTASASSSRICSLLAAGICLTAFYSVWQLGEETVSLMTKLMSAALPVIFAVTAISGGLSSATVFSSVIAAASTAFSAFVRFVLMPAVFASGIFTAVDGAGRQTYLKKASSFLNSFAIFGMGAAITLFTGISAIQGFMTKSADDVFMRTAKYSIDNLIPFVGGFTADSIEMIALCIKTIRSGVGVAGIVILIALLAGPLLRMLCIILVFRLTSLVLEPAGETAVSGCMSGLAGCVSILAALLFLSSVMFLIFFSCVIKFAPSL